MNRKHKERWQHDNQHIIIQTWNVNNKNTVKSIIDFIFGNKNRRKHEKGIYCFQEIPFSILIAYLNAFVLANPEFRIENTGSNIQLYYNNILVLSADETIGIRTKPNTKERELHYVNHGDLVCWNTNYFEYIGHHIPNYWKDSLIIGSNELGHRSSKWMILRDRDTDEFYYVISVHLSQNKTKAKTIFQSILNEAGIFINNGHHVIIAGDFNQMPDQLFETGKYNFGQMNTIHTAKLSYPYENITHENIDPTKEDFRARLDYVFVSPKLRIINEKIFGIYDNSHMTDHMLLGGHDHAILQLKVQKN